jgi:hypothetical protein
MPIAGYTVTDTYLELRGVGPNGLIRIDYTDIPGNSWNQNRLNKLVAKAQDLIDVRIPLNDPSLADDPDALVDPARPDFFHDAGDLVARSIIISDVTFDNVENKLNFTLSKAK